jgi:glycosyltransferase 2 family protein
MMLSLGIGVGLLFLWFAFRNIDFRALGTTLLHANWAAMPVFLVVLFLYYWLKALRWQRLLAPTKEIPTKRLFPALMVGYAVSSILPMHLGEVARVLIVRAEHSVRVSALAMSIAVERLLDLVTIPLLFGVAMLAGRDVPDGLVKTGYVIGSIGLTGIVMAWLYVVRPDLVLRLAAIATAPLPAGFRERVLTQLEAGAAGAAALREPRRMLPIVALTLLQWGMMWLCALISIRAVGIEIPWSAGVLTVALLNVAVALPTSPGFVGSVQAAFVLALLPFSVTKEAAIAASIYFHVLAYASVVIAGLIFMHRAGQSLRSLLGAPAPDAQNA